LKLLDPILILLLLSLAACGGVFPAPNTPLPFEYPQPALTVSAPQATILSPTASPHPQALRIWLPSQFDPSAGTTASDFLQARLDQFGKRRGIKVEVRIKAVGGPGGLLDSLTSTSAAASLALPDLVALPRDLLETAALKGLLHPFDDQTKAMDASDWYDYSQELARLQESLFGLPFAGDALVLVYRSKVISVPPADWATTLKSSNPLFFPASDPQALFTLAMYQADGGAVRDDQSRPYLDPALLSEVLAFYAGAREVGVMSDGLAQYQSSEQIWEDFLDNRADWVVAWSSSYLGNLPVDAGIAPIPTPDGKPFTLVTGWLWALASRQSDRQELAIELAEFLTDSSFLVNWTAAAGYLPVRSSVLNGWPDPSLKVVLNQVAISARLYPTSDILSSLGAPLQQATVEVLKVQKDPVTAAQDAAASLTKP